MAGEVPPPVQFVHNIFSSINLGFQPPQQQQQQEEVQQQQEQQTQEEEEEEQEQEQEQEVVQQQQQQQQREKELKYLEFVQFATVQAVMRCAILYAYAKKRSGLLKRGLETMEEAVKTVVAPFYDKFHLVPVEFLHYVDRKVDESVAEIDRHIPTNVKKVSSQAASVVSVVRRAGVLDAASGLAKTVYDKYQPKAEQCAVSAWRKLNMLPLFPQVAGAVVPKAAYCTARYNEAVALSAERGYKVSAYLPLVPTEKIAKVFSAVN